MASGKGTRGGGKGNAGGVSNLRTVALLVADIHLQARPPVARSAEEDWFAAMERPLREIANLAGHHRCPIFYAGDIFDRWNAGPEIIHFALRYLPPGYAVPGQHDLPNHNYDEMHRSAYGVLVETGHLKTVPPGVRVLVNGSLAVTGFQWGYQPVPLVATDTPATHEIALIHKFVWIKGCGYPGASDETFLSTKNLRGYTVAVYGDNHKGFLVKPKTEKDPWVINCGGFMRRKTDERDYKPGIGLLMEDGTVTRHYLCTEADKFTVLTAAEEAVAQTLNMSEFVDELKALGGGDALNFEATMKRFMDQNNTPPDVREVIMEAMGT